MLRDYIINAGMLVAFTSIIYQFCHNVGFSMKSPLKIRASVGLIFGLLAVVLMCFSLNIPIDTLIDFRFLVIIMAALSAGWLPAALCGTIAIIGRLLIFGLSASSYVAIPATLLVTLVSSLVAHLKIPQWKKWLVSVPLSLGIVCSAYAFLINDIHLQSEIIFSYAIGYTLLSVLMYYYSNYLETMNKSFRSCQIESSKDFLTGLNNVRSFDSLYNQALEQSLIRRQNISLIYIDIDFFKRVNDTYGHKEGDTVLALLGEILVHSTRSIDYVSRNGGEEFSVILTDCDSSLAMEIAERIRKTVEATPIKFSDGKNIHITVSLGVASFPEPLNDYKALREKADETL